LTWFNSIACYLGMCALICVILLVCINVIAFLNFRLLYSQNQARQNLMAWQMYGPVPVTFGWKRHVWDTPCIAGVSSRSLSLMSRPMSRSKMSHLSHAVYRHVNYRSCLAQFYGPKIAHVTPWFSGHSHKRLRPHLHIILHVCNSNFKQSIRFLATITMKRRLHSCRIVNMQKYVGAVRHRGLALRVAPIWIFDVFPQFGESSNIYWFVHFIKNASCWLNCIF
jgi:hypothetical protein